MFLKVLEETELLSSFASSFRHPSFDSIPQSVSVQEVGNHHKRHELICQNCLDKIITVLRPQLVQPKCTSIKEVQQYKEDFEDFATGS